MPPRCVVWERLPPSRNIFGQLRAVCGSVCPPPVCFTVYALCGSVCPPPAISFGQLRTVNPNGEESAPSVSSTANGKPNSMAVSSFGSLRPSVCLTAQTAKKSTGGSAERVWLKPPAKKKASSNPNQLPEGSPKGTPSTLFCYLCQDGGSLTECDRCSRSVCKNCLDIPPEFVTLIDHPSVDFLCVGCHWLGDQKAKASSPYVGFTRLGKPVLPSFLKVRGKFELGTAAHILAPRTLLLHLRLRSVKHKFHFDILKQCLTEYYPDNANGQFKAVSVSFDIGTDRAEAEWPNLANEVCQELTNDYEHVIVVITTHSDQDTGDLFLGLNEHGNEVAARIDQWLGVLLDPFEHLMKGSILYLLACGAVVGNQEAFVHFKQSVQRFSIAHALAFDAPRLSPTMTAEFLMRLTKSYVINGYPFTQALEHLLPDVTELGKHTSIIHFCERDIVKYSWTHREYQPWGVSLPIQCPACGVLQGWINITKEGGLYGYQCRNSKCQSVGNRRQEPYSFEVARPLNTTLIKSGNKHANSSWMKMLMPVGGL
ncbi:hypothetical protein JOM56_015077 [Amanita muscaria]